MKPCVKIFPQPSMADAKVSVQVTNLPINAYVTIYASTYSEKLLFDSFAVYDTGPKGKIDLGLSESIWGTYSGINQMGLLMSLEPSILNEIKNARFVVKDVTKTQNITLAIYTGRYTSISDLRSDKTKVCLTRQDILRLYMSPGTRRILINENEVKGTLFIPKGKGPFIGVINMLGAVANPNEAKSALLSSHGFATLNLKYFGFRNWVYHINMEFFEAALNFMKNHEMVNGAEGISVVGLCKGGQIALCMADCLKDIRSVIAINCSIVPVHNSHYFHDQLWPAVEEGNLFSLPMNSSNVVHPRNIFFPLTYNMNPTMDKRSMFKFFNKLNIPFLFLTALQDDNVPSEHFTNQAERLFKLAKHPNYSIIRYPGAGHLLSPAYTPFCVRSPVAGIYTNLEWGGLKIPHCKAQVDAWDKTISFLKEKFLPDKISKL